MPVIDKVVLLATLRGRAHELKLLSETMMDAGNFETYDRAYNQLCKLLEPIGDKLDLVEMEDKGYKLVAADTYRRK